MNESGKYTFVCYSKNTSCKLENYTKSGKVSFTVRSFVMVEHEEKLSVSCAPAVAVIPKAKGAKAPQPDHSGVKRVQVFTKTGAFRAVTEGYVTTIINAR